MYNYDYDEGVTPKVEKKLSVLDRKTSQASLKREFKLTQKKINKHLLGLPFFKHLAPCAVNYIFERAVGQVYP